MKSFNAKILPGILGIVALLIVGLTSSGCGSLGQPASASFASVTIKGKSARQILDATVTVFRENDFQGHGSDQELVFEREGSKLNSISRDGLVASHEGAVTMIRVRVQLVELGAASYRLQCRAAMVSNAGDALMQDEHPLANFRSRPYQKLLDEVAQRLK
jgi:hypothetical protein